MRALLDTNAYSYLARGGYAVGEIVRTADEIFLSVIVMGELLYGYRIGSLFESNATELSTFLARDNVNLVPVTPTTADYYSTIMASLRAKGRPIPTNDVWIAAHAMEMDANLVSADSHFENVDGIAWVRIPAR